VLVELAPAQFPSGTAEVVVGAYAEGRRLSRFKTGFIGPRDEATAR
jgi:hypothetical protein